MNTDDLELPPIAPSAESERLALQASLAALRDEKRLAEMAPWQRGLRRAGRGAPAVFVFSTAFFYLSLSLLRAAELFQ